MDSQIPGPDGFLFSANDPLAPQHQRLSQYLLAEEERSSQASFDLGPWRKLPKKEIPRQIEAALLRIKWLDDHDAELENAHLARIRLATLLRVLYHQKALYSEFDLRTLLEATIPLLGRVPPYGPAEKVVEHLATNDLTSELCDSLRRFQSNLREEMSVSQAGMQSLRQQVHMMLWMDEWETLNPARCWSESIRRDFRAFENDRRVRWRQLLKHLRGNAPVRMPAAWAKRAEGLLAAVGVDDFREQIEIWFAPFKSGEPLPLSVAGSHVLKGLIWFCAVAKDEPLKESCLWVLDAKWKQKRNTEKVLVALGVFGISKQALLERNLIKASPDGPAERLIEKMKKAVALQDRNHIRIDSDGDLIIVQGQLHFYRISRSTGRIERVSDQMELELDWIAVPDSLPLILKRQCDSPQQLYLRARFLTHDSIFGRYFRPK